MGDLSEMYLNASTRDDGTIKVITTGHSLEEDYVLYLLVIFMNLIIMRISGNKKVFVFDRKITCVSIAAPRVLNKTLADLFCDRVSKKLIFFERIIARGDLYQHYHLPSLDLDILAVEETIMILFLKVLL